MVAGMHRRRGATGVLVLAMGAAIAIVAVRFVERRAERATISTDPATAGAVPDEPAIAADVKSVAPSEPIRADVSPAVDLDACDRDLDLFGVVIDEAGAPVAGADVAAHFHPGLDAFTRVTEGPATRSGVDGSFALRLQRGQLVSLSVAAAGYGTAHLGRCQAGERVRIVLRPPAVLEVVASDARGAGVEGVDVRVRRWEGGMLCDLARGATDAMGTIRFVDLAAREVMIDCEHRELGRALSQRPTLDASRTTRVLVTLPAAGSIRGRVTDARTREPIAHARVGIGFGLERSTESDARGTYLLRGVAPDDAELHATAEGYGRSVRRLLRSEVVDFEMQSGDEVRGRVIDVVGEPLSGAGVTAIASDPTGASGLDAASAATTSDGTFRVTSLRHDVPHTLAILCEGHGRVLLDFAPHAGEAGMIELGDVVLPAARAIEGVVIDGQDRPQVGATVSLEGWNPDRLRLRPGAEATAAPPMYGGTETRRTDDVGRFRFPDLPPGQFVIQVVADGGRRTGRSVVVPPDGDVTGIVIRVGGAGELRVRVFDEEGSAVAGATVRAGSASAKCDAAGLAIVSGVGNEWYWVSAQSDEGTAEEVLARPSAAEIRLVIQRRESISGVVVDEAGAPLENLRVQATSDGLPIATATRTKRGGRFAFWVRKGRSVDVILLGRTTDGGGVGPVSPYRGELRGVMPPAKDLVLVARAVALDRHLDVRVVDPDGRPVASAPVRWRSRFDGRDNDARADVEGKLRIESLEDVPQTLRAHPGPGMLGMMPSLTLEAIPGEAPVTLALRRGVLVTARVYDAAGVPAPDARLTVIGGGREDLSASVGATFWVQPGTTFSIDAAWIAPDGQPQKAHADQVDAGCGEIVLRLKP